MSLANVHGPSAPSATPLPGTGLAPTPASVGSAEVLRLAGTVAPGFPASAPSISSLNVDRSELDVGQSVLFNATASGGTGTYVGFSWRASSAALGCALTNASTLLCLPSAAGTPLNVSVRVTDSSGAVSAWRASTNLTVSTDPQVTPPQAWVTSTSDLAPVFDVNQSIYLTDAPSGGRGPLNYTWYGLPTTPVGSCSGTATASPTCNYLEAGTYLIQLQVTDRNGVNSSLSPGLLLTVDPLPSLTTPVANVSSADVGQWVSFSTAASGAGPFSYLWFGLPSGCTSDTASAVSCPMRSTQTLTLTVQALDSNDGTGASLPLEFTPDPELTLATPVASSTTAEAGQPINLTVEPSGGTGDYPSFQWDGLSEASCGPNGGPALACRFLTPGVYAVSANVRDSNGAWAASAWTVNLTILPALGTGAPTPGAIVESGQEFSLSASVHGGSGPYEVNWIGLPTGKGSCGAVTDQFEISCTPNEEGTFLVSTEVIDALGVSSTSPAVAVTVLAPLSLQAFTQPPEGQVGSPVFLTALVQGGEAPYNVTWTFGNGVQLSGESAQATFSTPATYSATVVVTDPLGGRAEASLTITIASSSSTASPTYLGLSAGMALLAILAVFDVVLLVLVVVLSLGRVVRRTRAPAEGPRKGKDAEKGPVSKDPADDIPSEKDAAAAPEDPKR